ncbi:hypothetical protein HN873_067614 [Arachis hypogaea]
MTEKTRCPLSESRFSSSSSSPPPSSPPPRHPLHISTRQWDHATYRLLRPVFSNLIDFEANWEMYPQIDCFQDSNPQAVCNWTKISAINLQTGCH